MTACLTATTSTTQPRARDGAAPTDPAAQREFDHRLGARQIDGAVRGHVQRGTLQAAAFGAQVVLGKKGGAKGGKTAAERMTKAQRVARAKKAAAASAKVRSAKARAKREGRH